MVQQLGQEVSFTVSVRPSAPYGMAMPMAMPGMAMPGMAMPGMAMPGMAMPMGFVPGMAMPMRPQAPLSNRPVNEQEEKDSDSEIN